KSLTAPAPPRQVVDAGPYTSWIDFSRRLLPHFGRCLAPTRASRPSHPRVPENRPHRKRCERDVLLLSHARRSSDGAWHRPGRAAASARTCGGLPRIRLAALHEQARCGFFGDRLFVAI